MPTAEETFSRVYAVYGPALYRVCLLQMKHPADAEDVLQELRRAERHVEECDLESFDQMEESLRRLEDAINGAE